jgi:hypothetical protein
MANRSQLRALDDTLQASGWNTKSSSTSAVTQLPAPGGRRRGDKQVGDDDSHALILEQVRIAVHSQRP